MDLVGRLSNRVTTSNLQFLTSRDWHKAHRPTSSDGPRPDGRRQFGSVGRAIVQVVAGADSELRVRDVHKRVEYLLGEPISRSSVKNYLHKGSKRPVPLFEHHGKRGYRLAE